MVSREGGAGIPEGSALTETLMILRTHKGCREKSFPPEQLEKCFNSQNPAEIPGFAFPPSPFGSPLFQFMPRNPAGKNNNSLIPVERERNNPHPRPK